MFKNIQHQTQKQTLKLSPQQIQMLNLLHLPMLELEQKIKDELEENPLLEFEDSGELSNAESLSTTAEPTAEGGGNEDYDTYGGDENDNYRDAYEDTPYEGFAATQDNHFEKPMVETATFRENLKEQLRFRNLPDKTRLYAEYLIDTIDEDGYLHRSLEDICDDLSFNYGMVIEEEELESALLVIQRLDPVGIGSRSLQEYLMLQLREKARTGIDTSLANALVDEHMAELGNHQYDKIINHLQITQDDLKEALQIISSLNPKPVSGVATRQEAIQTITPDFVVVNNDGQLEITVMGVHTHKLKLNNTMLETLDALEKNPAKNSSNRSAAQYIKSKLNSAQWLISALEQREYSLTKTIETIVALQQAYFLTGDIKKLRPMILKDIAERVGLDVSTISRVTSTRYVQTDFGIISLKDLFSEGIVTDDGQIISNKAIQETILELVAAEDKANPLNDQQITDMLSSKGMTVARRTVAKYREQLHIPANHLRKNIL